MKSKKSLTRDTLLRKIWGMNKHEEERSFEKWWEESEKNRSYYRKAEHFFERYLTGRDTLNIDKEEVWKEFLIHKRQRERKLVIKKVLQYAAILTLPLIITGIAWMLIKNPHTKPTSPYQLAEIIPGSTQALLISDNGEKIPLDENSSLDSIIAGLSSHARSSDKNRHIQGEQVIWVPRAGEFKLTLPDGTKVTMNSESRLTFPKTFASGERKVSFSGEAYFQVAPDKTSPFIICCGESSIRVLGTDFNLSTYPDETELQTTLVEGKVEFSHPDIGTRVITPGEQVIFDKHSHNCQVRKVNTALYCNWQHGAIIFESERLESIMKKLARWYDITVFYQNPAAGDLVFTGDLKRYDNCEKILNMISKTTNVQFDIIDKTITVKLK